MIFKRFVFCAAFSLPSVLLFFPIVYFLFKKAMELKFNKITVFISFIAAWFVSTIPGFLYGQAFYDCHYAVILIVPIVASSFVILLFQVITINSGEQTE